MVTTDTTTEKVRCVDGVHAIADAPNGGNVGEEEEELLVP